MSSVSKFLDYNKLTFASQYTDGGFDNSLPNYLNLKNDKTSYFDINIGGNFSATFDHVSLVLGYAHYHLTRPQETLLNNTDQYVPSRQTVNLGMLYLLNNYVDLNVTGVYNVQPNNKDTILGMVVGLKSNDETRLKLNFGMWFKFIEASFYPYLGVTMGDVSAGLNYTVYANKVLSATPRTYELSLIYRHNNFKGFKVPCPKFR